MTEETEIITLEITTIFPNYLELPKPENPAIAKIISGALRKGGFYHDNVVVKQQRFFGEGKADAVHSS